MSSSSPFFLPIIMVCVVLTAVSNTILRKIAMVPMERYPLFLTICQTINYVLVYGGILYTRIETRVTKEMLQIRKLPFLWIGVCDSMGDLLGNAAIGKLPGYQPPLLAKLNLVFTALFSKILLGEKYKRNQLLSMGVVICGSLVTLIPFVRDALVLGDNDEIHDEDNQSNPLTTLFYIAVYISSVAPTALGFVLKERVFRECESSFDLDIFVVNTYTAIGGLLCQTVIFVPLASLSGVSNISKYMFDGYHCFVHDIVESGGDNSDGACFGSPLAPLLYLSMNILYNICFLVSIKYGGTLLTFITNTVTFPLSTLLFTCGISWPLLGPSVDLNKWILMGLLVEITGILWYYSEKTETNLFRDIFSRCLSNNDAESNNSRNQDDDKRLLLEEKNEEKTNPKYGSTPRGR